MTVQPGTILRICLIAIAVMLCACSVSGQDRKNESKGDTLNMKEYRIGRFAINIPAEMHVPERARSHRLSYMEIEELPWAKGEDSKTAFRKAWAEYLRKIEDERKPEGKKTNIIEIRDIKELDHYAKGVFSYWQSSKRQGQWSVLIDEGSLGLLLNIYATKMENGTVTKRLHDNSVNIGKSYKVIDPEKPIKQSGDLFYLQYGAIDLPYEWQEISYIRFEGHPLDVVIKMQMKMDEVMKIEKAGVIDKTTAAIVSKFAYGISVDRIRSRNRTVAGMEGQEELHRLSDKDGKELYFTWEFQGVKDSGYYPMTRITMDSPNGHLEEKLKIWDAMLDSMKPMFERKK